MCNADARQLAWIDVCMFELPLSAFPTIKQNAFVFPLQQYCGMIALRCGNRVAGAQKGKSDIHVLLKRKSALYRLGGFQ